MGKWKPLNMKVRRWAISAVLRLEQASSDSIKAILRMFKTESKTLGNQSSALSFKSKIDLLFDLDEIDNMEYSHLIKLMEIRNQFAHNPDANSFIDLDGINPTINKYLLKHCPSEIKNETNRELKLRKIFQEMFMKTAGKLVSIEMDYRHGIEVEMRKYLNDKVVEHIENIWQRALKMNKDNKAVSPNLFFITGSEAELENVYSAFELCISDFKLDELAKLEGKEESVFKQKITMKERVEKRREEKMKKANRE